MLCPECRKEQIGTPAFCRSCGARLWQAEPPQRQSKPWSAWASLLLGVLFGFVALVVIVVALDMMKLLQGSDGWPALLAASAVAGLVAGIPARGFWKGGLVSFFAAALGCAVLTVLGNRVIQSVPGGPSEQLSAWGSFVEMLGRGGGTAALVGAIAGYASGRLMTGDERRLAG